MKIKTVLVILLVISIIAFLIIMMGLINPSSLQTILYGMLLFTFIIIIGLIYIITSLRNNDLEKEELQLKLRQLEAAHKQQNKNIENQQDEIVKQMESINEKRTIIEAQKKELEDSITYAFRIQQAILPPPYYIDKILPSYFILYLPKAIVSGDFYFVEQEKDYAIIAAVDCTGHGVPGAMMSVIGYDLLNQAIKINHLTKPSEILTFVDEGVTNFLRQVNDESGVHDGMDISVISIHKQLKIVEFSGAYHEVYYTHKQNIYELKGDKFPIGVNFDGVCDIYNNHGVPVLPGDMIYLFSDGFADQFGGSKGKKFKYQPLKELLLHVSDMEPLEQKRAIAQKFSEWKEANEQVDDVMIIGVKI